MNCQGAREQIAETLAAGQVELSGDLTEHLQSCTGCQTFCAEQTELFRAMDSGLGAMVNESVPPSLLPRVRARLEEKAPRPGWISNRLTAAAAMAVVLLAVIFFSRVEKKSLKSPVAAIQTSSEERSEARQYGQTEAAAEVPTPKPRVIHGKATRAASIKEIAATPEVIVLRQEREVFARFLAELPREREAAVALTQAAPQKDEPPVEIARLQIDELKVEPLDSTAPDKESN
jgi:hypothetical protein